MNFKDNSTEIFILCFVIGLMIMCYKVKVGDIEHFAVKNMFHKVKPLDIPFGKQFNIDEQCNDNRSKYLGWKCWWRNNQGEFNVPNDNSFKGTAFQNYLNNVPLKYDGVFNL